jgi:undecaprenyl diphosphate synthase
MDTPLASLCTTHHIEISKIPTHVAIIMDGNGRWAKQRNKPRTFGHQSGVSALKEAITSAAEFGIKYISFWAFSTENWKRPKKEVSFLMKLIKTVLLKELSSLKKNGVRIKFYGFFDVLPKDVQKSITKFESETQENTVIQVNIMLNYGSRQEITEAFKSISAKNLPLTDITEETISNHLLTHDIPDPDILIRTSGEYRISNFLLWQLSYTELFFLDTLWPDFNRTHLIEVLQQFSQRDRRYGGVST